MEDAFGRKQGGLNTKLDLQVIDGGPLNSLARAFAMIATDIWTAFCGKERDHCSLSSRRTDGRLQKGHLHPSIRNSTYAENALQLAPSRFRGYRYKPRDKFEPFSGLHHRRANFLSYSSEE